MNTQCDTKESTFSFLRKSAHRKIIIRGSSLILFSLSLSLLTVQLDELGAATAILALYVIPQPLPPYILLLHWVISHQNFVPQLAEDLGVFLT